MARLIVLRNPLAPSQREIRDLPAGASVMDGLQRWYPRGFGAPIRIWVNGSEIALDDTDQPLSAEAEVLVAASPAGVDLVTLLVYSLISTLLSVAVSLLFAPKTSAPRRIDQQDPSSTYSVSSQQNAARLGQPIPVAYGSVMLVPDYISQPYTFFDQGSNDAPTGSKAVYYKTGGNAQTIQNNYGFNSNMGAANPIKPWPNTNSMDGEIPLVQGDIVPGGTAYVVTTLTGGGRTDTETTMWINGSKLTPDPLRQDALVYTATGDGLMEVWDPDSEGGQGSFARTGTYTVRIYKVLDPPVDTSADQYLDILVCLSKGDFVVDEVFVGDVPVKALEPQLVEYHVLLPADHGNTMGVLRDMFSVGKEQPFYENVASSSAVGRQEFKEPQRLGAFVLSETGKTGRYVDFDIEFPRGLFEQSSSTGNLLDLSVQFTLTIQEVDADLNPVGIPITDSYNLTLKTNNPMRFTYRVDGGKSANWQATVERTSAEVANQRQVNDFVWSACKLIVDDATGSVYEDTTIMGIRIKASEGLSQQASSQVRVRGRRQLPRLTDDTMAFTSNPADVVYDIYCNSDYGANRPREELELPVMLAARQAWDGAPGFNAVFTEEQTVFEALSMALQVQAATPLAIGSQISIVHDGVKPFRTQVFAEENILEGSFDITYDFDPDGTGDGVEIEYRDPDTFDPAYVRVPANALRPDRYQLFGSTDGEQSRAFAQLSENKRIYQRVSVAFDTELEGLVPRIGDRIAVAHTLPDWTQSASVLSVNGLVLTLDKDLDWSQIASPHLLVRDVTGQATDPVVVTMGASPNEVVLPAASSAPIFTNRDGVPTIVLFGDGVTSFHDFILADIEPRGGLTVRLSGVRYDARTYDNTAAYYHEVF